ncbi:MAG: hypothetical protein H6926_00395 [Chromatiales bacterium]|nr:hypothetical protein [Gammaproteobacteria bacterium]MCP5351638.1 hypothetical protein [Chromatiales bacterium]
MLCNRRLPRPTRLPHLSRFSIASGLVVILGLVLGGCTDTTRPDTPPAPVVDRSISGERQPARTVSRASEVVPLQPPRAEPTPVQAPAPTSASTPVPAPVPAPAPKANPTPRTAAASDPSQWPPPPMVEAPAQRATALPGDPDYRHERIEIGSAVNVRKPEPEPVAQSGVSGQRELPPLALARPEPIRPEKPAAPSPEPARTVAPATQVAKAEPEPVVSRPAADNPPAVAALLADADRQMRAGNADGAAASLERALRVEPRDAFLWHRLAYVRLQQGRTSDAESLALKSNSLAGDKLELVNTNWRLVARARRQQNNDAGAVEAESHLR